MIILHYVFYKDSPLATIVGIIGAICWAAGATCLIALYFAYGFLALAVAFILSCWAAPAISEHKENKQNGITRKRSARSIIKEAFTQLLVLLILLVLLTASCCYHIISNNNEAQLKNNAAATSAFSSAALAEGRYIEEEGCFILPSFAYEGETIETATAYFAIYVASCKDGNYCVPFFYTAKDYDTVESISTAYVEYLYYGGDYAGEYYTIEGKTLSIDKMNRDVYGFYMEELEYYGLTDMAAPFFIDMASYRPPLTNLPYYIILGFACVMTLAVGALVISSVIYKRREKDAYTQIQIEE